MALTGPPGVAIVGQILTPTGKPHFDPELGASSPGGSGRLLCKNPQPNCTLLLLSLVEALFLGYSFAQLPEGGSMTGLGPSVAAAAARAPKPLGKDWDGPQQARSVAECRGGEVGRGEAGPLGSAPRRQALTFTHGPGIGEWREERTHPGKVGARARCMLWGGGGGE